MNDKVKPTDEPLVFQAVFVSMRTMVDGSWRISFDLSDMEGAEIAGALLKLRDKRIKLAVLNG